MQSKAELVRLLAKSDLPACNTAKEAYVNGRFVCVANVDGEICAMDNVCPHWGGPLGQGKIEDGKLICPWHGWIFDPKTGETPRKAGTRVSVHAIKIEGDDVFITFQD